MTTKLALILSVALFWTGRAGHCATLTEAVESVSTPLAQPLIQFSWRTPGAAANLAQAGTLTPAMNARFMSDLGNAGTYQVHGPGFYESFAPAASAHFARGDDYVLMEITIPKGTRFLNLMDPKTVSALGKLGYSVDAVKEQYHGVAVIQITGEWTVLRNVEGTSVSRFDGSGVSVEKLDQYYTGIQEHTAKQIFRRQTAAYVQAHAQERYDLQLVADTVSDATLLSKLSEKTAHVRSEQDAKDLVEQVKLISKRNPALATSPEASAALDAAAGHLTSASDIAALCQLPGVSEGTVGRILQPRTAKIASERDAKAVVDLVLAVKRGNPALAKSPTVSAALEGAANHLTSNGDLVALFGIGGLSSATSNRLLQERTAKVANEGDAKQLLSLVNALKGVPAMANSAEISVALNVAASHLSDLGDILSVYGTPGLSQATSAKMLRAMLMACEQGRVAGSQTSAVMSKLNSPEGGGLIKSRMEELISAKDYKAFLSLESTYRNHIPPDVEGIGKVARRGITEILAAGPANREAYSRAVQLLLVTRYSDIANANTHLADAIIHPANPEVRESIISTLFERKPEQIPDILRQVLERADKAERVKLLEAFLAHRWRGTEELLSPSAYEGIHAELRTGSQEQALSMVRLARYRIESVARERRYNPNEQEMRLLWSLIGDSFPKLGEEAQLEVVKFISRRSGPMTLPIALEAVQSTHPSVERAAATQFTYFIEFSHNSESDKRKYTQEAKRFLLELTKKGSSDVIEELTFKDPNLDANVLYHYQGFLDLEGKNQFRENVARSVKAVIDDPKAPKEQVEIAAEVFGSLSIHETLGGTELARIFMDRLNQTGKWSGKSGLGEQNIRRKIIDEVPGRLVKDDPEFMKLLATRAPGDDSSMMYKRLSALKLDSRNIPPEVERFVASAIDDPDPFVRSTALDRVKWRRLVDPEAREIAISKMRKLLSSGYLKGKKEKWESEEPKEKFEKVAAQLGYDWQADLNRPAALAPVSRTSTEEAEPAQVVAGQVGPAQEVATGVGADLSPAQAESACLGGWFSRYFPRFKIGKKK